MGTGWHVGCSNPFQQRIHVPGEIFKFPHNRGVGAVAHVDKPDVVAFSVESSQVWLVVVFKIMDAHQVLFLRALLHVISNGLRAKRLRLRIIQRGGIQTAVGGANVPFAHDYGHSGGLAQALLRVPGDPGRIG